MSLCYVTCREAETKQSSVNIFWVSWLQVSYCEGRAFVPFVYKILLNIAFNIQQTPCMSHKFLYFPENHIIL
jgi:hypothetical protein